MSNQKKIGLFLSYFNTILNIFISFFLTPFLIKSLGNAEYGLYRIVQSVGGQLSILTFGVGQLVTRFVITYNLNHQDREKENFMAIAIRISFVMSFLVLIIGFILLLLSDYIFANSLTSEELKTSKVLLLLFIVNVAITIFKDYLVGLYKAYEKFIVFYLINTFKEIFRLVGLVVLMKLGCNSIAIISVDLTLTILIFLFDLYYSKFILKEKIKFHYFDKALFKSCLLFSSAVFLQAIINQVNQNLDSFILGIMTDTETVAVYSVALTIFTTFNGIIVAISSINGPSIIKKTNSNVSTEELSSYLGNVGKFQFFVVGIILTGFIIFGKEFITIWVGKEYLDVYKIALILMIPMSISLIQEGCQYVLYARMKNMAKSIIFGIMALINIVTSVILVKIFGYIGAAYGTAISVIISIIILDIYYYTKMKINVLLMLRKSILRLLPIIISSCFVGFLINKMNFFNNQYVSLIFRILFYTLIYLLLSFIFGTGKKEKNMIVSHFKRKDTRDDNQ